MCTERILRLIAGTVILLSLGLGCFVNRHWLLLTAFAGFNLLQSGFTNRCPAKWLLERAGTHSDKYCG